MTDRILSLEDLREPPFSIKQHRDTIRDWSYPIYSVVPNADTVGIPSCNEATRPFDLTTGDARMVSPVEFLRVARCLPRRLQPNRLESRAIAVPLRVMTHRATPRV